MQEDQLHPTTRGCAVLALAQRFSFTWRCVFCRFGFPERLAFSP